MKEADFAFSGYLGSQGIVTHEKTTIYRWMYRSLRFSGLHGCFVVAAILKRSEFSANKSQSGFPSNRGIFIGSHGK
jgi:hypothetical protein